MSYEPGQYQKGEVTKIARSRREAVALSFDGFHPVDSDAAATEQAFASPTVSETSAVLDETNDESALDSEPIYFDDED